MNGNHTALFNPGPHGRLWPVSHKVLEVFPCAPFRAQGMTRRILRVLPGAIEVLPLRGLKEKSPEFREDPSLLGVRAQGERLTCPG
jgi:hypothetical protein